MEKKILTKEGLAKLQEELVYLKDEKRYQVADRIKQAKEFGDLSENAEYQEAKEEQAFVEGRILELENLVKTAAVAENYNSNGKVNVGSKVLLEKNNQEKTEFTIVGSTESDPINRKISLESPLAQVLLDKKVGDSVELELPVGKVVYKIIEIN
ncbi:transcription elongation factor GreA [Candidatus Parcubacteria bacterium]|nr:MAG: transcription elongation factor GreA [Candidatus Parcubacteria bacterium]